MNTSRLVLVSALGVLVLGACANKETPAETQKDVAAAAATGAENVADQQRQADNASAEANKDINKVTTDSMAKVTEENLDVVLAKAKADYKVAVEQCEASTGSAREACKSAAQATLDAVQARVDARKP